MPHPFARAPRRAPAPVPRAPWASAPAAFPAVFTVALATFLAAALALLPARPALAGDWPMFQGDAAHSGITQEALTVPMALEWKYKTAYYAADPVSPIVAGKTIYLAAQNYVVALDADTGEQRWRYPEEGAIGTPSATTIRATPAVANGVLYVGANDGVLYALKTDDGTLLWQFQTGGHIRFAPIVVGDVVYFGSDDHKLYAVDAKTGKQAINPIKTEGDIIGSPSYSDNTIYFTSSDLHLYAAGTATGRVKWTLPTTNANIYSTPVATDRYVFTVGGNNFYCVTRGGDARWIYQAHNPVSTAPLVTEDSVYFGDRGGRLYALDLKGRERWSITDNSARAFRTGDKPKRAAVGGHDPFLMLAGPIYSSPVLSGGNIIVGTNRGFLYAVDPATGKINWEYSVFANLPAGSYPDITAAPAIANGRLYVMSDDGTLHCFRPDALDATKPEIGGESPLRATEMNGTPPIAIGAVVSDEGSGINSSTIQLKLDGAPVDFSYQPNTGQISYKTPVTQPIQPLEDGRHTVSLTVSDWKGNTATDSWTFTIDNRLSASTINTPTAPASNAPNG